MTKITRAEFFERGIDDDMQIFLSTAIGETLPPHVWEKMTTEERNVLGYGPPCPCGEKGMLIGEELSPDGETCMECFIAQGGQIDDDISQDNPTVETQPEA